MAAYHLMEYVRDGEEDPGLPAIAFRTIQVDFPVLN